LLSRLKKWEQVSVFNLSIQPENKNVINATKK